MRDFFDSLENESKVNKKIFAKTSLIQNVTEDIMIAMEDLNISKSQLAKKLGKSKSYITQILSGSRNMTLSSLSDLCFELEITPTITLLDDSQLMDDENPSIQGEPCYWHKEDRELPTFIRHRKSSKKAIPIDSHPEYRKAAA